MLGYYAMTALASLRRSKVLATLMVMVIGLGIGASMTMITIFHVLSGAIVDRLVTIPLGLRKGFHLARCDEPAARTPRRSPGGDVRRRRAGASRAEWCAAVL